MKCALLALRRAALACALLLIALGSAVPALAQDGGTRSVFAEGAGNRALGMGSAYVAMATDASAPIWNAGGLGWVTRPQLQVSYTSLYGLGFGEQYASFVLPDWRFGVGAVTLRHFGTNGIEARDERNLLLEDDLSDSEMEVALSYGRAVGRGWGVGGSLKYQRQSLAGFSGSGLGADVGLLVNPGLALDRPEEWLQRMTLGVSMRNLVEPSIRLDQESVKDPRVTRVGMGYVHPFAAGRTVVAALDVEKSPDMDPRVHAGLEITVHPLLAMRTGLKDGNLAAGVGLHWRDYMFDYTFEDSELGAAHRVGVDWRFGSTIEERRHAALLAQEEALRTRLAEEYATRERDRVTELLTAAEAAARAGDLDRALEQVTVAGALDPDNVVARELEADLLLEKADREEKAGLLLEAMVTFGRVLARDPANKLAAQGRARCRSESDLRAERYGERRKRFGQGLDAFTAGDLLGARDAFQALLVEEPGDAEAVSMLARTREAIASRAQDQVEEARRATAGGAFDDADRYLAEARRLDPAAPGLEAATRALGDARRQFEARTRREAEEKALQARLTGVTESAPSMAITPEQRREIEDLYERGLTAMKEGRGDDALRYWELVFSALPDHAQVKEHLKREYLLRGMDAFATGRLDEAVTLWEKALRVDPEDEKAQGYLARAREQRARAREILGAGGTP